MRHWWTVAARGNSNLRDINPFVLALTSPWSYWEQYPLCDIMNADLNCDGAPGFGDINPFVQCIVEGGLEFSSPPQKSP